VGIRRVFFSRVSGFVICLSWLTGTSLPTCKIGAR
jgi:hypothetical protein